MSGSVMEECEWPDDCEKECASAEYCSSAGFDRYDTELRRHRVLASASSQGMDIPCSMISRAAEEAAECLAGLCQTYPMSAVQNGPVGGGRAIPRFFGKRKGDGE